jgi:hypothetical protein
MFSQEKSKNPDPNLNGRSVAFYLQLIVDVNAQAAD